MKFDNQNLFILCVHFDKLINIHKYANELISIFSIFLKINLLAFDCAQNWVNRSFFNDSTASWKMSVEFEKKIGGHLGFWQPTLTHWRKKVGHGESCLGTYQRTSMPILVLLSDFAHPKQLEPPLLRCMTNKVTNQRTT